MGEGKVRLGMLYRVSALVALALVLVQTGIGSASVPTATTVVANPNFETLAVDPGGMRLGHSDREQDAALAIGRRRSNVDTGDRLEHDREAALVHHAATERRAARRLQHRHELGNRALGRWRRYLDDRPLAPMHEPGLHAPVHDADPEVDHAGRRLRVSRHVQQQLVARQHELHLQISGRRSRPGRS